MRVLLVGAAHESTSEERPIALQWNGDAVDDDDRGVGACFAEVHHHEKKAKTDDGGVLGIMARCVSFQGFMDEFVMTGGGGGRGMMMMMNISLEIHQSALVSKFIHQQQRRNSSSPMTEEEEEEEEVWVLELGAEFETLEVIGGYLEITFVGGGDVLGGGGGRRRRQMVIDGVNAPGRFAVVENGGTVVVGPDIVFSGFSADDGVGGGVFVVGHGAQLHIGENCRFEENSARGHHCTDDEIEGVLPLVVANGIVSSSSPALIMQSLLLLLVASVAIASGFAFVRAAFQTAFSRRGQGFSLLASRRKNNSRSLHVIAAFAMAGLVLLVLNGWAQNTWNVGIRAPVVMVVQADDTNILVGGDASNYFRDSDITGSTVTSASCAAGGGAILVYTGANLTVANGVTFDSNSASGSGGAVLIDESAAVMGHNVTFRSNTANCNGGAVDVVNEGAALTTGSGTVFQLNTATSKGGAIHEESGSVAVTVVIGSNSLFDQNTAGYRGGAIKARNYHETFIGAGAVFTNNFASNDGGALYSYGSSITFQGTWSVSGNTDGDNGVNDYYLYISGIVCCTSCPIGLVGVDAVSDPPDECLGSTSGVCGRCDDYPAAAPSITASPSSAPTSAPTDSPTVSTASPSTAPSSAPASSPTTPPATTTGCTLAAANGSGVASVWNITASADPAPYQLGTVSAAPGDEISALVFNSDGTRLLAGTSSGEVRIFNAANHSYNLMTTFNTGVYRVEVLAYSTNPLFDQVALGGAAHQLRIYGYDDSANDYFLGDLVSLTAEVVELAFTADGSYLAAGCADGTFALLDVAEEGHADTSYNVIQVVADFTEAVTGLAFAPDGSLLASASENFVQLWSENVATGTWDFLAHLPQSDTTDVTSVVFSLDANLLVGLGNSDINVWTATNNISGIFYGLDTVLVAHTAAVWTLAVHGTTFASASGDGTVKIWEPSEVTRYAVRSIVFDGGGAIQWMALSPPSPAPSPTTSTLQELIDAGNITVAIAEIVAEAETLNGDGSGSSSSSPSSTERFVLLNALAACLDALPTTNAEILTSFAVALEVVVSSPTDVDVAAGQAATTLMSELVAAEASAIVSANGSIAMLQESNFSAALVGSASLLLESPLFANQNVGNAISAAASALLFIDALSSHSVAQQARLRAIGHRGPVTIESHNVALTSQVFNRTEGGVATIQDVDDVPTFSLKSDAIIASGGCAGNESGVGNDVGASMIRFSPARSPFAWHDGAELSTGVASLSLSDSCGNPVEVSGIEDSVVMTLEQNSGGEAQNNPGKVDSPSLQCFWWNSSSVGWDPTGCTLASKDTCRCNHLTAFAVGVLIVSTADSSDAICGEETVFDSVVYTSFIVAMAVFWAAVVIFSANSAFTLRKNTKRGSRVPFTTHVNATLATVAAMRVCYFIALLVVVPFYHGSESRWCAEFPALSAEAQSTSWMLPALHDFFLVPFWSVFVMVILCWYDMTKGPLRHKTGCLSRASRRHMFIVIALMLVVTVFFAVAIGTDCITADRNTKMALAFGDVALYVVLCMITVLSFLLVRDRVINSLGNSRSRNSHAIAIARVVVPCTLGFCAHAMGLMGVLLASMWFENMTDGPSSAVVFMSVYSVGIHLIELGLAVAMLHAVRSATGWEVTLSRRLTKRVNMSWNVTGSVHRAAVKVRERARSRTLSDGLTAAGGRLRQLSGTMLSIVRHMNDDDSREHAQGRPTVDLSFGGGISMTSTEGEEKHFDDDSCAEWQEVEDPASGYVYYHNTSTGATQWEKPQGVDIDDLLQRAVNNPMAGGGQRAADDEHHQVVDDGHERGGVWQDAIDPASGSVYYYNESTGETKW